jgi:hypothetical protein
MVEHFYQIIILILLSTSLFAQDQADESEQMAQLEELNKEIVKQDKPSTKSLPMT